MRLLLANDELDKTYLYFTYTENGVAAAGQFRGNFPSTEAKVFHFSRFFDRVELVIENTSYWFDPAKPISRAADANISHAVAAEQKIEALYLAALTRQPRPDETEFLLAHIREHKTEAEQKAAFAQILWGLLNNPEFVLSR